MASPSNELLYSKPVVCLSRIAEILHFYLIYVMLAFGHYMKKVRTLPAVTVSKKAEKKLSSGHVWVFAEEVCSSCTDIADGELCDVFSQKEKYLGTGFFNSRSLIRIRIISKNANDDFSQKEHILQFWKRRVLYAVQYRKHIFNDAEFSSCRLIFGEADGFPGITVDKFETVLVCQCMCLGMEKYKLDIYRYLIEALHDMHNTVTAVYERNDSDLREKEGLPQGKNFLNAELGLPLCTDTIIRICENGILYDVDFCNGQKTGFFLDQKYNRQAAAKLAHDKSVLDCFTHTGSFGLNCLKHGAKSVSFVDISARAISETRTNVALNQFDQNRCEFITQDAFDFLLQAKTQHRVFDLVILDPPAFTKASKTKNSAMKGYREINRLGMGVLRRGGFLATASCSHFVTEEDFMSAIESAARDLNFSVKQIAKYSAAADHPIIWDIPETAYLKFFIVQLV